MKTCDNCEKQWDCYEPCNKVIAWQELQEKDRCKEKDYIAKGITPLYTKAKRIKLKKAKGIS